MDKMDDNGTIRVNEIPVILCRTGVELIWEFITLLIFVFLLLFSIVTRLYSSLILWTVPYVCVRACVRACVRVCGCMWHLSIQTLSILSAN